jgi:hypothetical protein
MAYAKEQLDHARRMRFSRLSATERSQLGRYLRRAKGAKHAHVTLCSIGHYCYMRYCRYYRKLLQRPLTPLDKAYIRNKHSADIIASIPKL